MHATIIPTLGAMNEKAPPRVLGMIQSNYIPWRGYFDFIKSSDVFVIYDDVQYTAKDWRNRNIVKTATGPTWVTVPVAHSLSSPKTILESCILYDRDWARKHVGTVTSAYARAPFFKRYAQGYFDLLHSKFETISQLNVALIRWAMDILEIKTPILFSTDFNPTGVRTDRILDIVAKIGAKQYLVGPSAQSYIEVDKFKAAGIDLEFKTYSYPEYPQLHGKFDPRISIIDLIFNCGPTSANYIKSMMPNERA
jgi:hypothetical protein